MVNISTTHLKETKWRYALEKEPLWKRVIDGKHGKVEWGGTYEVRDGMGLGYGRQYKEGGGILKVELVLRWENGRRVKFSMDTFEKDTWLRGVTTLSIFFPSLFPITTSKGV